MSSSSHSTPKRRRVANGNASASATASPAARALSGIRSWLSPWRGSAPRSAAFGGATEEEEDGGDVEDSQPGNTSHAADLSVAETEVGEDSVLAQRAGATSQQGSLYPALPQAAQLTAPVPPSTGPSFPFTFTPQAATASNPFSQQTPPTAAAAGAADADAAREAAIPSPLSRNYDVLSRFFAEKAAAEANGHPLGAGVASSFSPSRLTEEEIRGCLDLIQQSGTHPDDVQRALEDSSFERPAPRRRNTVRRSWLSPAPSHASRSIYDHDSQSERGGRSVHTDMSFSPERESSMGGVDTTRSYLAPLGGGSRGLAYSSTEPASIFAQSLTGRRSGGGGGHAAAAAPSAAAPNPFLTGSTSVSGRLGSTTTAAARRRRRPLYLGPGMSASTSTTGAGLRRRVQQPSAAASASTDTTTVGLGKRQRTTNDVDDDAGPTTANGTSMDVDVVASPPKAAPSLFGTAALSTSSQKVKSPPPPSARSPPTPRQTRAANAMLSILAEPDLPKPSPPRAAKKSAPAATASSNADASASASTSRPSLSSLSEDAPQYGDTSFRPDTILNPYQSAPGLKLGKSSGSGGSGSPARTTRSSEAFEKMKNERRKSTRLRRSGGQNDDGGEKDVTSNDADASASTSLLEQIERTRPASMRGGSRTAKSSSRQADDTRSNVASGSVEPPSTPLGKAGNAVELSTTPSGTPPQHKQPTSSSESKTAEARRRLEEMRGVNKSNGGGSGGDSGNKSSGSGSGNAAATAAPPSSTSLQVPNATPSKPSFFTPSASPFSHAHAPGKPSRLSIAFNANESPSSTGSTVGDDDDEEAGERNVGAGVGASKPFSFSSDKTSAQTPFTFGKPSSASTPTPTPTSAPFTFGKPAAVAAPAAVPSPSPSLSTPSLSFKPAPVPSLKSSGKETKSKDTNGADADAEGKSKTSNSTDKGGQLTDKAGQKKVSFAPATTAPSVNGSLVTSTTTKTTNGKATTSPTPSDLPQFDLTVDTRPKLSAAECERFSSSLRAEARRVDVGQLPLVDLGGGGVGVKSAGSSSAVAPQTAAPQTTAPQTTMPSDTSSAAPSKSAPGGNTDSNAAPTDDAASSQPPSSSALTGSGEGEEGETTDFEVRAKFWKFVGGSWVDSGVGIARVKRRTDGDGSNTRRLLVRNATTGAVSVNFTLHKEFKVTQTGSSLSFTGFDEHGKGLPMRCKVKTEDSAREFKEAMEKP